MRIRLLLILFFVFGQINSNAQVIEKWKVENTISDPTVISTDMIYDGQNTYVTIQNFNTLQSAYLQKLDSMGNLLAIDTIDYVYSICDNRMARDQEGSIYVCGQKDSSLTASSKVKITKFDSLLNPVWSLSVIDDASDFYSPRICYSPAENKIYVICQKSGDTAYYSAVFKFDTSGNMLWVNDSIPSLGLNCIRYAIDNIGNIILGGFRDVPGNDEDFTLVKIDTSGAVAWTRTLSNPLDDRVEELAIDNDNNIYAFGYFSDASRSRVVKYDSDGNFLWMSNITNFYGSRIATNTTGIYVAGNDSITNFLAVYKLDPNGNITGSEITNNTMNGILNIKISSAGEIYVCYSSDSLTDYRWAICKFDSLADELWTFKYPSGSPVFAFPTSFNIVEDGFIVSGLIQPFITTVHFLESNTTGISEKFNSQLIYWPNPADKTINFSVENNSNNSIQFKIIDIQSRCIFESFVAATNDNRLSVNLHGSKMWNVFFYSVF